MKIPFDLLFLIFVVSPCLSLKILDDEMLSFNVINYGAKGDGQNDDSQVCACVYIYIHIYMPNLTL